jgi:hypothetical protein
MPRSKSTEIVKINLSVNEKKRLNQEAVSNGYKYLATYLKREKIFKDLNNIGK